MKKQLNGPTRGCQICVLLFKMTLTTPAAAAVWRALACVRGKTPLDTIKQCLVPFFTTISAHRHHIEVIKRKNAV